MTFQRGALTIAFSVLMFGQLKAQVDSSAQNTKSQRSDFTLVLTKKSSPAKRMVFKEGDRILVVKEDWTEVQGRVEDIRNKSIHFAKDSVSINDIRSIKKKKPFYTKLLGATAVIVGAVAILEGQVSDVGGSESTIIGSTLIAGSFFLFYQKRYGTKKWRIGIEPQK